MTGRTSKALRHISFLDNGSLIYWMVIIPACVFACATCRPWLYRDHDPTEMSAASPAERTIGGASEPVCGFVWNEDGVTLCAHKLCFLVNVCMGVSPF